MIKVTSKLVFDDKHQDFEVYDVTFGSKSRDSSYSRYLSAFNVDSRPVIGAGAISIVREKVISESELNKNRDRFAIRTRLPIGDIHFLKSYETTTSAISRMELGAPEVLRILADDRKREDILSALSNQSFIRDVSRFIIGPTQRVKIGSSRRYSFMDLHSFVSRYVKDADVQCRLVITKVVYESLLPLDIHYNSLEIHSCHPSSVRLMSIDDVGVLAKEMEIKELIGDVTQWRDKRVLRDLKKGAEVWVNTVEESLSYSVLNFRTALGRLSLFSLKTDAVMLCARMALVSQIGAKTNFKDFMVANAATSDQNIQAISRWAAIAEDFLSGGIFDEESLSSQYSRGLSLDVISSSAQRIVSAIENHPLVTRLSVGEFNERLAVKHVALGNGNYHWQTVITGATPGGGECSVFNEFGVGTLMFRPSLNPIASGIVSELSKSNATFLSGARDMCAEVDACALVNEAEFIDSADVVLHKAEGLLSLFNINVRELAFKCLTNYDITFWYEPGANETSDVLTRIAGWGFNVPKSGRSVITALSVVSDDLIINDIFSAAFLLSESASRSNSLAFELREDAQKEVFGKDFLAPLALNENVQHIITRARGQVGIKSGRKDIIASYQIDLEKVFFIADSIKNHVMYNRESRFCTALTKSQLKRFKWAFKMVHDSVSVVDSNGAIDTTRLVGHLMTTLIEAYAKNGFFNNLRRVILDDLVRSVSDNTGTWANWVHNINLRTGATLAALRLSARLTGIEDSILSEIESGVLADPISHSAIFMYASKDNWINVELNKL